MGEPQTMHKPTVMLGGGLADVEVVRQLGNLSSDIKHPESVKSSRESLTCWRGGPVFQLDGRTRPAASVRFGSGPLSRA